MRSTAWRASSAEPARAGPQPAAVVRSLPSPVALARAWSMSSMQVVDVLEPDREADRSRARMPAAASSPGVSWRWVVDAGWIDEGLGVAEVEQALEQLHRVEEREAGLVAAGDAEGDDRRHPAPEVALDQVVVRVVGEAGEAHPGRRGGRRPGTRRPPGRWPRGARGGRPGVSRPWSSRNALKGERRGPGVAQLDGAGPHGEGPVGKSRANTTPWNAGSGSLNMGKRSACSVQGNRPPSTMAPPVVVPWPPDELGQRVHDDVGAVLRSASA